MTAAGTRFPLRRMLLMAALAAIAAAMPGCTDVPSGLGWDHTYPEGLVVRGGGAVLVEVDPDGEVSGSLTVAVGKETGQLEVIFLDEKGAIIVPADDEYLEVTISFPDQATFEPSAPGAFTGRFRGLKAGQTNVIFTLKQGEVGRGTGLWNSPAIRLTVTP